MAAIPRDENFIPAIFGVSDVDGETPVAIYADPTTHELYVKLSAADIEIGAVEIKDGDSDTRLDVESDGSKNAAFVQANNLDIRDLTNSSDSILIYGSDDGGTTKRVIKTDSGGAIQVDLEVASVSIDGTALSNGQVCI